MRRLFLFLVCGLIGFSFVVRASTLPQTPTGVEVYGFEWHARFRSDYSAGSGKKPGDYDQQDPGDPNRRYRSDPQRLEMSGPSRPMSTTGFVGYESSLQLKNVGVKTIIAIEWQHVFFIDENKQAVMKRFEFRKKIKIEPGEQKFVAKMVHPRHQSKGLPPFSKQSVVINSIEYADGSAWQRP